MRQKQSTRDAFESVPDVKDPLRIARVLGPRGKNMHEVQFANNDTTLVILPPRFRNLIWVKRGHYVVVDPTAATTEKLGGEITHILFPEHIKQMKSDRQWPKEFEKADKDRGSSVEGADSEDSDSDGDLHVNNNRVMFEESDSEEED